MASVTALPLRDEIEYPESDGQPMAETDLHRDDMFYLVEALDDHFRDRPDVYVSGNLFLYYEQGNPHANVAPDLFVVEGVAKHKRETYRLWEEGVAPSLVVEVTSKTTRKRDEEFKKPLYARLGVREYFLFDPKGEYLTPPLQGFRLRGAGYRPLRPAADGSLKSYNLGISLRVDDGRLRMIHTASGELLLRGEEARQKAREEAAARQAAENEAVVQAARAAQRAAQAAQEEAARQAADERAAQEQAARRAAEERAAQEQAARQAADERAAQEQAARQAADERAARLEEELARLRGG